MKLNQIIDQCESTNDIIRMAGEQGAPTGTWIIAREQTQGRGRLDHTWVSQRGNLFLSFLLREVPLDRMTWLPLLVGVVWCERIRKQFSDVRVTVKWPNDLEVDGRKMGGILCEGVSGATGPWVVVGLGLNLAHAPQGLDRETVCLNDLLLARAKAKLTVDEIVSEWLPHAIHEVIHGLSSPIDELIRRFFAVAALQPGDPVSWNQGKDSGKVIGLGPAGELRVELPGGEQKALYSEEIKQVRSYRGGNERL